MYPEISPRHQELIDELREYGEKRFSKENISQWRHEAGLPDEVVKDFVDLDFKGFNVLNRGADGSYDLFAQVLVAEELARVAGTTLPFTNDLLNLQIMAEFADSSQFDMVRDRYAADGRLMFALAISEPEGGSDTMGMKTTVATVDGRLILNGRKTFVNNGEYAPYLLIAAIDGDLEPVKHPPLSLWLLPHGLEGISVYPIKKAGQSILPFSDVIMENVVLDESYRLAGAEPGFPQLFRFFDIGRIFSCATALGLARAAMEDAVAYASKRQAFGADIIDFQMIQQMLVDMEIDVRAMRDSVYRTAREVDRYGHTRESRLSIALMKRFVPETATKVASNAMQILGGRGYINDERVSMIWRDCRGFQIAEGTDQIMVRIAAPLLKEAYGC